MARAARQPQAEPGATHAAVPTLRARLAVTHDFKGNAGDTSTQYDDSLVAAVKLFHFVTALRKTVPSLEKPLRDERACRKRIEQINLDMERWRWLPRDLGPNHSRVNIREYRLDVGGTGALALRCESS